MSYSQCQQGPRSAERRRGNAIIEFALVFILFLSIILGFMNLAYVQWIRVTLHAATREGVRHAVTGKVATGASGHRDSIRKVVQRNSFGLIEDAVLADRVKVIFRNDQGAIVESNAGGNLVEVQVFEHALTPLSSALMFSLPDPLKITVVSAGRLEPYPVPPAL